MEFESLLDVLIFAGIPLYCMFIVYGLWFAVVHLVRSSQAAVKPISAPNDHLAH